MDGPAQPDSRSGMKFLELYTLSKVVSFFCVHLLVSCENPMIS